MRFDADEKSYPDNVSKDQRKKRKFRIITHTFLPYRKKITNMQYE